MNRSCSRGKLLLFDIDGTLLSTGGAGISALKSAFADQFTNVLAGRPMPEINFSGSTDSGIVRDLCRHFDFEPDGAEVSAFFAEYLSRLQKNLQDQDPEGRGRLPGVLELLHHLVGQAPDFRMNLLTGNIQAGAWIKVRHYGVADYFTTGAFGDDHYDRNQLCPVAVERERRATGLHFPPEDVIVIGDTPKDIACGQAHGAKTLAVATGMYTRKTLAECSPSAVFDSFEDAAAVLDCLRQI